ncbi:nucleotide sugar dehydrogenase [Paenibacillus sp. FSL R7-0198]|uniref:nucleotide sugar dehydrogenase n=1 Tax=unclassified Paenibacillus TaxID=185978 RepID=UPI0030DC4142
MSDNTTQALLEDMSSVAHELTNKIKTKNAKIAIIGAGYIGLTLAVQLSKAGFIVWGLEDDQKRVEMIQLGISYIEDVSTDELSGLVREKRIIGTSDFQVLKDADIVIICVPTPLSINKEPDISIIRSVTEKIAGSLHSGQLVILESTTYPGTTDEVILPCLERTGFRVGVDYFLAHSPERVDFGNINYTRSNVPKVVGGSTSVCTKIAQVFFESVALVVPVSSALVAEMVKVYENTYRMVNIGLVNEITLLCDRMGINVWEMLEAAFTKPYGLQEFYPGPGIGGHCIPIDPHYLAWKAKEYDFPVKFVELASDVNSRMPYFVIDKTIKALNNSGKPLRDSRVLVLGVAYKKNIADYRESSSLKIIELLHSGGASVMYHDPNIASVQFDHRSGIDKLYSVKLTENILRNLDAVVIVTDHSFIDYDNVVKYAPIIIDTRNATKNVMENREKIILL